MYLKLRQERQKHNWTQEYVAKIVGVAKTTIQMIETGQRKPSYDVLVKLEKLFHKSHRTLFAVADDTPNSTQTVTQKQRASQATRCSGETGD